MLTKENLLTALRLRQDVLELETRDSENGDVVSYDDVCWRKSDGG